MFRNPDFRSDVFKLIAFALVTGIGLYALDSFLKNQVRPGIDKVVEGVTSTLVMEKAKDAVLNNIRESSGLHRPEFSYKWEVVPLSHARYRMSSMECSLESGERICRSFAAVVDTGAKHRIEEIRFY